jgi:cell division protease FtsH
MNFLPAAQDQLVSAAEATGREIDLAVRDLIEQADGRARSILEGHRSDLEAGVELLMLKETLTADDFPPLRGSSGTEAATDRADVPARSHAPVTTG